MTHRAIVGIVLGVLALAWTGAARAAVVFDLTISYDNVANLSLAAGDLITIAQTPLPAALPLVATGIGGLGLLGWRRKRKAQASLPN